MAEQCLHLHGVQQCRSEGVITTPAPGSTLSGSSVTFSWTAGTGATAYWLDVGIAAGWKPVLSIGEPGQCADHDGERTADRWQHGLCDSVLAGEWAVVSNAYTYTAFNLAAARGVLTTPTPGSTLTGSSVTFIWTAGAGASAYWLDVGMSPGGTSITIGEPGQCADHDGKWTAHQWQHGLRDSVLADRRAWSATPTPTRRSTGPRRRSSDAGSGLDSDGNAGRSTGRRAQARPATGWTLGFAGRQHDLPVWQPGAC